MARWHEGHEGHAQLQLYGWQVCAACGVPCFCCVGVWGWVLRVSWLLVSFLELPALRFCASVLPLSFLFGRFCCVPLQATEGEQ